MMTMASDEITNVNMITMAADEIAYNRYFHLLQDEFRNKYEEARNQNWLICIPTSEALRGVDINEYFVDLHMLQPCLDYDTTSCYCSVDEQKTLVYKLHQNRLELKSNALKNYQSYTVNILREEIGYNVKFQPYVLLIVDKLLSPCFIGDSLEGNGLLNLNDKISSLEEALNFVKSCTNHVPILPQLKQSIQKLTEEINSTRELDYVCTLLKHTFRSQWTILLRTHPLHHQKDARFQFLLSVALENYIVNSVHQDVFPMICAHFAERDREMHSKTVHLSNLGISPDQLGAPEDLAVKLPAAVVELAELDNLQCPIEKLTCLNTCLELILAEVKAAFVDFQSLSFSDDAESGWIPQVVFDNIIPLLMAVLIQAKPLHLISNIFYMEQLQWSLAPNDTLSCSLVTFKAALKQLLDLQVEKLRPRSKKVHKELTLENLIMITGEIEQPDRKVTSPLDREWESITAMIEAATKDI